MAVTNIETVKSRVTRVGDTIEAERIWHLGGSNDDVEVLDALLALAPAGSAITVLNAQVPAREWEIEPQESAFLWEGRVGYSTEAESGDALPPPETNDVRQSFSTAGGTIKITNGEPISSEDFGGLTAQKQFGSLIGVTGTGEKMKVEGVSVVERALGFDLAFYAPVSMVTASYINMLFTRTGTVNDDVFFGFAAGEVLMQSVTGNQRNEEDWELNFSFKAIPNGPIELTRDFGGGPQQISHDKDGHDVVWVHYVEDEDANFPTLQPEGVYVNRVYLRQSFSGLQIPGS